MLLNFHPSFSFLRVILFVPHDVAPDLLACPAVPGAGAAGD
jgi:hypothetical protein